MKTHINICNTNMFWYTGYEKRNHHKSNAEFLNGSSCPFSIIMIDIRINEFEEQGLFYCIIWKVYTEAFEKNMKPLLKWWLWEMVQAFLVVNLNHYHKVNSLGYRLWPFKIQDCQVREQHAFCLLHNNSYCTSRWIQ